MIKLLSGKICHSYAKSCYDHHIYTKFEVFNFTYHEDMKCITKYRKWGSLQYLRVTQGYRQMAMSAFDRAHTTSYSPLIEAILYRLQNIARYLTRKSPILNYSACIWGHIGSDPLEFRRSFARETWSPCLRCYLRHFQFNRFDTIPGRVTDTHRHAHR